MDRKKVLALSLICASMFLLLPLIHAEGPSTILTVWTDKPSYSPGETGKLYVAYNNIRDGPVSIRYITIIFSKWWAYDKAKSQWLGNITYTPPDTEKTVTEHTIRVYEISFTVPSDGRAVKTDVDVKVYTNLPTPDKPDSKPEIVVVETPVYMEQITTLFTILVVLVIICTVIIASTIFLSTHRPQVTWKTEEKPQT